MTHQVFSLPRTNPLNNSAQVIPGARLRFYLTGTTTPTAVYTTSALSVTHTQPVEADSAGRLPVIYLDPNIAYKVTVSDASDALQYTVDPVNDAVLSQAVIGAYLYPRTAAETSAGVTPVNYAYPPEDSRRYGIVADGATNNDAAIASWLSVMTDQGGGEMYFRGVDSICINDDILLPSRVTVYCETKIKRTGTGGTYDAIFVGAPGATDITVINPRLDCNNQPGMGCIIMRADNLGFKVIGGTLENCAHDPGPLPGKFGGRAINIEAGVSDPDSPKSTCVTGVTIRNCYMAIAISGGDDQEDANCAISNITAENCEVLIGMFGNSTGYPHNGASMSFVISNIIARNCGASAAYPRDHGIICADRGCNALLSNIYVFNDSTYGTVSTIAAVLYGDFSNVHISNFVYEGDCAYIFAGYGWQEVSSIVDGGFVTQSNRWQIKVTGTVTDIFTLSSGTGSRFINSELDFWVGTVTNNRAVVTNATTQDSVYMKLYEETNNVYFEGFLNDMVTGYTLSSAAGKKVYIGPAAFNTFDVNGNVYDTRLFKLDGSATWDPASIANGASASTTVTVTGAALGDMAVASFSLTLSGLTISAYVSSTNNVTVVLTNNTGGAVDLSSGTVRARVWKQ